jgi:hypothetical protein
MEAFGGGQPDHGAKRAREGTGGRARRDEAEGDERDPGRDHGALWGNGVTLGRGDGSHWQELV